MQGKVIQFKADLSDFKVKNGEVSITLKADTDNIVLDKLNEISEGAVMVHLEASQTELIPEDQESKNQNANN